MKKDFASSTLTEISFPPDASKIVQIATGNVCSVALDEKGKVWAWGSFRVSNFIFKIFQKNHCNNRELLLLLNL